MVNNQKSKNFQKLIRSDANKSGRLSVRVSQMTEAIQKVARGDYSAQVELSEKNDELDSLAIGLNMMIDDIRSSTERDKKRVKELEKAYQNLKNIQNASLNIMEDLEKKGEELRILNDQLKSEIIMRKYAEKNVKETLKGLERSNKELENFAYIASHDLQEPLRMVRSYLQLLERRYKGKLAADADEFIGYAVDGATRMQGLINDLLTYSRVGTKGKPFESVNMETIFQQVMENLKVAIEENEAVITHDPLSTVMVDSSQILQLLQNLIGNSIKFKSEEPPKIHISATKMGSEWVFSVSDNGIGINPKYQKRIFQIFQRLHTRDEYPGSGIGLAVCKKIVHRHGGRIWVESGLKKGSIFNFTIPDRRGDKQ